MHWVSTNIPLFEADKAMEEITVVCIKEVEYIKDNVESNRFQTIDIYVQHINFQFFIDTKPYNLLCEILMQAILKHLHETCLFSGTDVKAHNIRHLKFKNSLRFPLDKTDSCVIVGVFKV